MRTSRRVAVVVAAGMVACTAGWTVPVAARVPARAALVRDGVTPATAVAHQQSQLTAPGDLFGSSTAVDGNTLVVSAPLRAVGGNDFQGVVYVFTKPANGGWSQAKQVAQLTAGDGATGDRLGWSVAVSGDTIVASAPDRTVGGNTEQGAVYVFTTANGHWTDARQAAELTVPDGAANDQFGYSAAVNGNTIVASAPRHTVGGNIYQGAAYVFTTASGQWTDATEAAELAAPDGAVGDWFGYSVAASGNAIAAGAPYHAVGGNSGQGAAYVFTAVTGRWTDAIRTMELTAADGTAGDWLGTSVAASGNTIVAGAPLRTVGGNTKQGAAYVFTTTTGDWTDARQAGKLTAGDGAAGDQFGNAVAIAGHTIVAGAPDRTVGGNSGQGAAYVFVKPGGGWTNATATAEFIAGGGAADDQFGYSAAVAGGTVFVGAPQHAAGGNVNQGTVYLFGGVVVPTLGHVTQSHKTWRLGSAKPKLNPAHHGKAGTVFSFTLNTAATVTLHFVQQVGGRTVSRGTLTVHARAGRDHVSVAGPLGHRHQLRAGHCTVTLRAQNLYGHSAVKTLHFTAKK